MEKIALVIGVLAVIFFLLSYQQKKRRNIIAFNILSRALYILQYVLLGAFEGAVLDIGGIVSSFLAQKKNIPFIKKNTKAFVIVLDIIIVAVGLVFYKNIFSLFPIVGVILHTTAFWIDDERIIRIVSLAGSPFWLVYNLVSGAYGSAIGDVLTIVSILTAMIRYDFKKEK